MGYFQLRGGLKNVYGQAMLQQTGNYNQFSGDKENTNKQQGG